MSKLRVKEFTSIFVLDFYQKVLSNKSTNPTHLIIANPRARAGKAKQVIQHFEEYLRDHSITFFRYNTQIEDNKSDVARLLSIYPINKISIIGGDGTINLALNSLPSLDLPIHIIPAGTGNDFAKMLYPKKNLGNIFSYALNSTPSMKADVWQCNERRFINGFGVGFDGKVAHKMYNNAYISSKTIYWIEILKLIFTYNSSKITIDGEEHESFMVCAANGQVYGGDFKIAPEASIDDGMLDVIEIRKNMKILRAIYIPMIQKGKHLKSKLTTFKRHKEVTIKTPNKTYAHIDGEPIFESIYCLKLEGQIQLLVN